MPGTLHEQAIDILQERLEGALGGELLVQFWCKEYPESHSIDLLRSAASIRRNLALPGCRPDLTTLDTAGNPVVLIEVVVSHAPERNVQVYAIERGLEVVEFHLPPTAKNLPYESWRPRKSSDEAVLIKRALTNFRDGSLVADDHNLLCPRPQCEEGHSLPLRQVSVEVKDCWKCEEAVTVAVGRKDSNSLYPDDFTSEERVFAREQGVILERRFSNTVGRRYLANVCGKCDQIQGNWFLYEDPFHDTYRYVLAQREVYGPCDKCAEYLCLLHGEYVDHENHGCPECRYLAERTMCGQVIDRECFYPDTCQEHGCYFQRREQARRAEEEVWHAQAAERRQAAAAERAAREQRRQAESTEWAQLNEWINARAEDSADVDHKQEGQKD